jgi:hypothetical protein
VLVQSVGTIGRRKLPVDLRNAGAPGREQKIPPVITNLVAQIIAYNQLVVLVAGGDADDDILPLLSAIVLVVPDAVSIDGAAAPLGVTDVVVEDDGYSSVG